MRYGQNGMRCVHTCVHGKDEENGMCSSLPAWGSSRWLPAQVKFEEAQHRIEQDAAATPAADGDLQRAAFGLGECLQVNWFWCLAWNRS